MACGGFEIHVIQSLTASEKADGHQPRRDEILFFMSSHLWSFSCFLACIGALSCAPSAFPTDAGAGPSGGGDARPELDASYRLDAGYAGMDVYIDVRDASASSLRDAAMPWDAYAVPEDVSAWTDAGDGVVHDAGAGLLSAIDHAFLIRHFGGNPVNAYSFVDDETGFQEYLDAVGVTYFDATEIVTPNNPEAAAACGYMILLPGQDEWEKIGALALFADRLRALVGEPVWMRNWWRPDCYNTAVGGAPGGDHPDADAVDLDFLSASSRAIAQAHLCSEYWQQDIVDTADIAPDADVDPRLNMSVGLGGATIHLGVLSRNGRRFWKYGSYTEEPDSGTCW